MRILVAALLVILLLPAVAGACPLCKDAKSDADYAGGTASLPHGFNYSIYLMVAAPFAVVGAFVLRIVRAQRKLRGQPRLARAPASVTPSSALAADPPGAEL